MSPPGPLPLAVSILELPSHLTVRLKGGDWEV